MTPATLADGRNSCETDVVAERGLTNVLSNLEGRTRTIGFLLLVVNSIFGAAIFGTAALSVLSPSAIMLALVILGLVLLGSIAAIVAIELQAARPQAITEQQPSGVEFLEDFPPNLRERRDASFEVFIIGVSLSRTIETSYAALERNARRGAHIRLLVTDPDADAAAVDARTQSSRMALEDIRAEIRQSLNQITRLVKDTGGSIEVRLTPHALKFGVNLLDVSEPNAMIVVQCYSFRTPGEAGPIFVLERDNAHWFDHFRLQAESLWVEARDFTPTLRRVD